MIDDTHTSHTSENGKAPDANHVATAIRSILATTEYGHADSTSISKPLADESVLASTDPPSPTINASGDGNTIEHPHAVESQPALDQPAAEEPASETPAAEADEAPAQSTPDYPDHPYAKIIPPIVGSAFDILVADTERFGQREPIFLHDGQMLDGRDQLRACLLAGARPAFEVYVGNDPLGFLINRTVRRRSLNEAQRALAAARVEDLKHGGDRKSAQYEVNLPVDRSAAAKMFNVSPRSVTSAAKVIKKGEPKLVQALEQGLISVSAAAKAADLSTHPRGAALRGWWDGVGTVANTRLVTVP